MMHRRNWSRIILALIGVNSCAIGTVHAEPNLATSVLDSIHDYNDISILGLGSMGQAFVKCLLQSDGSSDKMIKVHAWNRGSEKRDLVRDMGATVYDTAAAAVQASNITLVLIDDWDGVIQLVTKDVNRDVWSNKIVVLFSTYSPNDIIKLETEYFRNNATTGYSMTLVGGAIVGVPQTVCSPKALILLSKNLPQIRTVGRVEVFNGNVGYAALVNMALILVITFGIAGQELAHLIIQQYGVTDSDDFFKAYIPLSTDVGPEYTRMLLPILSGSVVSKAYERSYVPVGTFRNVLQMHVTFMKEIGIVDDTFLTQYLHHLNKVTNTKYGPAAWIEEVKVVDVNVDSNVVLDKTLEDQEL